MARVQLFALVFFVAIGLSCGTKSDEEILQERIDSTPVHLYLATKIAILKADQSPEARAARDELMRAIAALRGTEGPSGERRLSPRDALTLAKSLYELRAEGQELLESGDEKGMTPILPKLFKPTPELEKVLDLNLEHGLLLGGLFGIKFHPKTPAPVPDEVLLYEAWMTKPATLQLAGLKAPLHALKAVVYGQNELCDLAQAEAKSTREASADLANTAGALQTLSGGAAKPSEASAKKFGAALRTLAHGTCAMCFQNKKEKEKSLEELDAMVIAAEEMGVPPGETALIRAYLAYERDDKDKCRAYLEQARDYPEQKPETKKDIEQLLSDLDDDEMYDFFGKGFFALFGARLVVRELDRAGAFDGVKNSQLGKAIDGYLGAASGVLGKAKDLVPSAKGCLGSR